MSESIKIEIDMEELAAALAAVSEAEMKAAGAPFAEGESRAAVREGFAKASRESLIASASSGMGEPVRMGVWSTKPGVTTRGIPGGFADFWSLAEAESEKRTTAQFIRSALATPLNRETRVVMGLFPGGRALSQSVFFAKRLERGIDKMGAMFSGEEFSGGAVIGVYALIAASAIIATKAMFTLKEEINRERVEYEQFLRKYRPKNAPMDFDEGFVERVPWYRRWLPTL